ncbi:hypothetical protein JCM6882_007803 [Rhodosporidiobolus microsporus]
MATATATINGTASRASSSTTELKQHYQAATRAFLVRDYPATASSLHNAFQLLPPARTRAWFDAIERGDPLQDLHRRLLILQVTFLATVRSAPVQPPEGGRAGAVKDFAPLLDLPTSKLIKALWDSVLSSPDAAAAEDEGASDDILPTPSAAFLHPSLAVSLTLAALKLDSPRQARQIAEAWFGSVDGEVEKLVWDASQSGAFSVAEEFPLDGVGAGGASGGMSGSSILGQAGGAPPARIGSSSKADEAKKALVGGWLKLLDLLVLHVLPKLGEWEAAGDFVRLQGVENGGWVPDDRVEAALRRLDELQREQAEAAAARIQRQKDLDAAKAEKKRASRSSASVDKGKGKAREASPPTTASSGSSSGGSPKKGASSSSSGARRSRSKSSSPTQGASPRTSPPAFSTSTFSGLRSSLSSYLARPSPSSSSSTNAYPPAPAPSRSPLSTFLAYLRYHYSTDPVRLLSIVAFGFAFVTWARRRVLTRRARGERGLGLGDLIRLVGGKVGETVGMATRVTAM